MLAEHTVRSFLQLIRVGEDNLAEYKPASLLYHLEARYSLYRLKRILSQPACESKALIACLGERWEMIQGTDLQYLHDFVNPTNQACTAIAEGLAWYTNKSYLILLMPSLAAVSEYDYIVASYEDDPDLKAMVLSDCNQRLIHIPDVLNALENDGTLNHNSLFNRQRKPLSEQEKSRVLSRHPTVQTAYEALLARENFKVGENTVGAQLNRLIQALFKGTAGADDVCSQALVAIAAFNNYLATLDGEVKTKLMLAKKAYHYDEIEEPVIVSVADMLDKFARPKEFECEILSDNLRGIAFRLEDILLENSFLYDLESSQDSTPTVTFATLQAQVEQTTQVMLEGLSTVTKHACYGEEGDDALYSKLMVALTKNQEFLLSSAEIAYIANTYVVAKAQGKESILQSSEAFLHTIRTSYPLRKVTEAMNKMTVEAKQQFIELTWLDGFTRPWANRLRAAPRRFFDEETTRQKRKAGDDIVAVLDAEESDFVSHRNRSS